MFYDSLLNTYVTAQKGRGNILNMDNRVVTDCGEVPGNEEKKSECALMLAPSATDDASTLFFKADPGTYVTFSIYNRLKKKVLAKIAPASAAAVVWKEIALLVRGEYVVEMSIDGKVKAVSTLVKI